MAAVIITVDQPRRRVRRRHAAEGHVASATPSSTYSLLTVGDGLVSQIPALLMSVATGVIVTRADRDGDVGNDLVGQLTRHREALRIGGGALLGLCLVPGMPKLPFLIVGAACCWSPSTRAAIRAPRPRTPTARGRRAAAAPAATRPRRPRHRVPARRPARARCSRPTSSTSSTPPAAATCSTACARCAARPRSTSASCCRPCAPATASTCRPAATRSAIGGVERGDAARRRPGTCSRSATRPRCCPGAATTEPVFGLPAVWVPLEHRGHRRGRRRHPRRARRGRHHPPRRDGAPARRPAAVPRRRQAARSTCSRPSARRWSRRSSRPAAAGRACSGCCRACSTSRCRSATSAACSRASASAPGSRPTPTPCSRPPAPPRARARRALPAGRHPARDHARPGARRASSAEGLRASEQGVVLAVDPAARESAGRPAVLRS